MCGTDVLLAILAFLAATYLVHGKPTSELVKVMNNMLLVNPEYATQKSVHDVDGLDKDLEHARDIQRLLNVVGDRRVVHGGGTLERRIDSFELDEDDIQRLEEDSFEFDKELEHTNDIQRPEEDSVEFDKDDIQKPEEKTFELNKELDTLVPATASNHDSDELNLEDVEIIQTHSPK